MSKIDLGSVSAFDIAVKNGYAGTEADWVNEIAGASESAEAAAKVVEDLQSITKEIGSLTIVLGEDEYIYDGSSDVTISVPDADNTQY